MSEPDMPRIDVGANRNAVKWTRGELVGRMLWAMAGPLFALSPRPFWGWRRMLLKLFGARVGEGVHIYPTVRIAVPWNLSIGAMSAVGDRAILYNLGPLSIGERVTISQNAHLCGGTHDHRDPAFPLIKSPIGIGNDVWICADAFIGPGVEVGDRTIVGARAVVMKRTGSDEVIIGNPAKAISAKST